MAIQNAIKPTTIKPTLLPLEVMRVNARVLTTSPPLMADTPKPLSYPFLAGLIDGDGHIRSYRNTCELTITMYSEDFALAEQLKSQFGGNITKVLNKNAIRFTINSTNSSGSTLSDISGLVELIRGINGHVRNSVRTEQFEEACSALGIKYLAPKQALSLNDGYIAGLFCSDGSIFINCRPSSETRAAKRLGKSDIRSEKVLKFTDPEAIEQRIQRVLKGVAPLIEIKIFNKSIINVKQIAIAFGFGNTYFGKGTPRLPALTSQGGHYFYVKKEEHVLKFVEYMALYNSHSIKHKRLSLVQDFYRLKSKKAHLPGADAFEKTKFEKLIRKWFSVA